MSTSSAGDPRLLTQGSEFHEGQSDVNNEDHSSPLEDLSPHTHKAESRAVNVPNEKTKVVKNRGPTFYGSKKMKDARKAKKRCVEGCDMYIARVKRGTDEWAMSKPCKECWEVMRTLGIRKVYYTTGDGRWMCEKVVGMESTYRSSGVLALQAYREQDRAKKQRRGSK